ncbi:CIC11C00000003268 [Sungouiella intermedia]|uniref:CIC11C00000003268 n=1 Tax=Sungouiella intermedia TaxID=45354 RepID=A0A1L0DHQ8_9ASCO|nr:CIC11C00000003268 [[Candida] intermedia]
MVSITQAIRRVTAAVCVSATNPTTIPDIPTPAEGSNELFLSPSLITDRIVTDTEIPTTRPSKTTQVGNHFREFRPCKRLVAKARKLKSKIKKTFKSLKVQVHKKDKASRHHKDGIVDNLFEAQFSPLDPEEYSPYDFSNDKFYSMRAMYNQAYSGFPNRNLVLTQMVTDTTGQTSIYPVEFSPQKYLNSMFTEALISPVIDSTSVACTCNQFTPFFFQRMMDLFVKLQNYIPTPCVAPINETRTWIEVSLVRLPESIKSLKPSKKVYAEIFSARVPLFVQKLISIDLPPLGLRNIQSWSILGPLGIDECKIEAEEEKSVIYYLDEVEKEGETKGEEEVEDSMGFVDAAEENMPDYRQFYLRNSKYQVDDPGFEETYKISSVTFSDRDQFAEFHSEDAPVVLFPNIYPETLVWKPLRCRSDKFETVPKTLRSCLKNTKHKVLEIDFSFEEAPGQSSDEFILFQTDNTWFWDVCDRFDEATKIKSCPIVANDKYWDDISNFIAISQQTFMMLSVGISETKIYGLHEIVGKCDWAVKLAAEVFSSYFAMVNRYEVVIQAYWHADDLWSLENVQCSLFAERKRLCTLRKSIQLLRNAARIIISDKDEVLKSYATESKACVTAVTFVLQEFDLFFANTLMKANRGWSPEELQALCGKVEFDKNYGPFIEHHLSDADSLLTHNIEDIVRGIHVLETLDASLEAVLIEMSECISRELKLNY